jgi:thymidylate kinase
MTGPMTGPVPGPAPGPLHVALMGVDGAGKSSIATELAGALRAAGRPVEIVSFKRALAGGDPVVSSILGHVAYASLKCQYAEAELGDPDVELESLLSADDVGRSFPAAERRLRSVPVERNSARPFLSSALLEVVGGCWVQSYVEGRLRAGVSVVDESYAFKHVLKNVLLAQRLAAPGSAVHAQAQGVLDTAVSLFGGLLAPAVGCWVDTDPQLALRWRAKAGEETTAFENYGLLGEIGDESFLAMQDDCRLGFADAARRWGWRHVTMEDRPREENIAQALRLIAAPAG